MSSFGRVGMDMGGGGGFGACSAFRDGDNLRTCPFLSRAVFVLELPMSAVDVTQEVCVSLWLDGETSDRKSS